MRGRRSGQRHDPRTALSRRALRSTFPVVRSVVTDGRIFRPGGTFEFRVEPHGNGSRITNHYDRRSKTLLGRCVCAMLQLTRGAPIKRSFRQVYGTPG